MRSQIDVGCMKLDAYSGLNVMKSSCMSFVTVEHKTVEKSKDASMPIPQQEPPEVNRTIPG